MYFEQESERLGAVFAVVRGTFVRGNCVTTFDETILVVVSAVVVDGTTVGMPDNVKFSAT